MKLYTAISVIVPGPQNPAHCLQMTVTTCSSGKCADQIGFQVNMSIHNENDMQTLFGHTPMQVFNSEEIKD